MRLTSSGFGANVISRKETDCSAPRLPRKKRPARLALGTREAEYGCNNGSCLRIITWLTTQVF
jgi:hypothetical protein